LLFSALSRHRFCGSPFSLQASVRWTISATEGQGNRVMQKVGSLLRAAPSRIGRRLAQIVAIAAASLPQAGA
jgi:hypothetical protein